MNKKTGIIFWLFFLCLAGALFTGGNREKSVIMRVTGKIRLIGNGFMTELVITGQENEWYIPKEEEYKFKDLQQRTVTVQGSETIENLTFASGLPAGERRTLKNIRIIAID